MSFEELLLPIEEITFSREKTYTAAYLANVEEIYFHVDDIFTLQKLKTTKLWFWSLTNKGIMFYPEVYAAETLQKGHTSWIKVRDEILHIFQERSPNQKFKSSIFKSRSVYRYYSQQYLTPIRTFHNQEKLWVLDVPQIEYTQDKMLLGFSAKTRQQLLQKTYMYLADNLFNIYQSQKEQYMQDRNMILSKESTQFNFWWPGFVKLEINLKEIFKN